LATSFIVAPAPLAENTLKFIVGAMLTTFGIFWAGEGVGVEWPGQDAAILAIVSFVSIAALVGVRVLRRQKSCYGNVLASTLVRVDQ